MDVISTCPLRVASFVWQPRNGAWALTVVCKATLALEPGQCRLLEVQEDPTHEDSYCDNDRAGSLYAPSDLAPFKLGADVVLVGHAFAPRGESVRALVARLAVGEMDKRVEVWCDRIFWQDGQVLEGPPFARMQLRYERAAGGPGTWNPVGVRFDAPPDAHGAVRIPNLQPMGVEVSRRGNTFDPISFGPIASSWPVRSQKLRRRTGEPPHDWRTRPIAGHVDPDFFNVVPDDQRVTSIRPDERIVLENLHPDHARLETRLPGLQPKAVVMRAGQADESIDLTCDTLWIAADRGLCTVVWRGSLPLSSPEEAGRAVVSLEDAASMGVIKSVVTGDIGMATYLLRPEDTGWEPDTRGLEQESEAGTQTVFGARAGNLALPFVPPKSLWANFPAGPAEVAPVAEEHEEAQPGDGTGTLMGGLALKREVLPFVQPQARQAALVTTEPMPSEMPVQVGYVSGTGKGGRGEASPWAPLVAAAAAATSTGGSAQWVEERREEAVAPPAMSGPLAKVEPRAPAEVMAEAPAREGQEGAKRAHGATELPLAEFSIERCAAIAASIARRKREKRRILEENELETGAWERLDKHWNDAVRKGMERGKPELMRAYDAAYVGQLEKERGPITLEEYARLVVAADRGDLGKVMTKMTLQREAMIRIERVWLAKIVGDTKVGAGVRMAVNIARSE